MKLAKMVTMVGRGKIKEDKGRDADASTASSVTGGNSVKFGNYMSHPYIPVYTGSILYF